MLGFIKLVLVLSPLAVVGSAIEKRDHTVTFVNNCGRTVTPVYHDANLRTVTLSSIGPGQATSLQVPEAQLAWRAFGQTGQCSIPDGVGCTLLECSFDNPGFRQCDISRIDGFNLGMSFSFNAAGCGGNACLTSSCPPDQAFSDPTNGGASIRQCNTPGVSMTVTFSC